MADRPAPLSLIDAAMFALETAERPLNIGPLFVLAPPGDPGAYADGLAERLLALPAGAPFTWRLRSGRWGWPAVEPLEGGSVRERLHRTTLEAPGSSAQLCEHVARLHATRLDRNAPLWEAHLIEGLEGGRVALYMKVHHGILDGRALVEGMVDATGATPDAPLTRAPWAGDDRRTGSPGPVRPWSWLADLGATVRMVAALLGLVGEEALGSLGVLDGARLPWLHVPRALHGPKSPTRSLAFAALPLPAVKALAHAHGATVNDVLLTVLALALTRQLQEVGTLPAAPLVADMPILLPRSPGQNRVAVLQFPLGEPALGGLARLAAVVRETRAIKALSRRVAPGALLAYTSVVHGVPALLELLGLRRAPRISTLMVSNPFGVDGERYLLGARVERCVPIALVSAGQMLDVTAVSVGGQLHLGFLAVPTAVPDVEQLARYAEEAFEALAAAPP